jgi:Domain of unknown function (DUF309)
LNPISPDFSDATQDPRHNSTDPVAFESLEKIVLKDYVTLFNAGRYFEAHEIMEAVWIRRGRPAQDSARALVQLAAALEQLRRKNLNGAARILARARPVLAAAIWTHWNVPCAVRAAERRIARAGTGAAPLIKPRRSVARNPPDSEQVL